MNQEIIKVIKDIKRLRESELAKSDDYLSDYLSEIDKYSDYSTNERVEEARKRLEAQLKVYMPELLKILEDFDSRHFADSMFEPWKKVFVNGRGEITGEITLGGLISWDDGMKKLDREFEEFFKAKASEILSIDPQYFFTSLTCCCLVGGMRRRY